MSFLFELRVIRYVLVMLIVSAVWKYAGKKTGRWSVFKTALTLLLSFAAVNTTFSLLNGFMLYETLIGLFESIVGFVMVYVFSRSADVLWDQKRRQILSGEEVICLSIFLSLIIIGFWDITVLRFSLRTILTIFLILMSGYMGGAGTGAAIGITSGFMLSLASSPDPALMGSLAICGLLAGTFRNWAYGIPALPFPGKYSDDILYQPINLCNSSFRRDCGCGTAVFDFADKTIKHLKRFSDSGLAQAEAQQAYGRR